MNKIKNIKVETKWYRIIDKVITPFDNTHSCSTPITKYLCQDLETNEIMIINPEHIIEIETE